MVRVILILTSIVLMPINVFAGTISGGGGKLIKFSQNPWFLENTKIVKICVKKYSGFGDVSEARLMQLIEQSLSEWKKAFSFAKDDYYKAGELEPYGELRVATQKFVYDCAGPDIEFAFGGLTDKQKKSFPAFKDYVGAAVLTNYDLKQMSGTGFVYIAAMSGEFSPSTKHKHPDAWKVDNNRFLKYVLLHEIGHIFGIPHDFTENEVSGAGLMQPRTPEWLINPLYVNATINGEIDWSEDAYENAYNPLSIFKPSIKTEYVTCGGDNEMVYHKELFALDKTTKCTKVVIRRIETPYNIDETIQFFESPKGENGPWYEFAEFEPDGVRGRRKNEMQSRVYLPESQKVFTKLPGEMEKIGLFPLYGEMKTLKESYHGKYKPLNGGKYMGVRIKVEIGQHPKLMFATPELEMIEISLW